LCLARTVGSLSTRAVLLPTRDAHDAQPDTACASEHECRSPSILRHAHAVELLREGIALPLTQCQLGHSHLSTAGTYRQGISQRRSSRPFTLAARR